MTTENFLLAGKHVRLEPLEHRHVDGLVAAAAGDRDLYQWSPVPQDKAEPPRYVDTALAWRRRRDGGALRDRPRRPTASSSAPRASLTSSDGHGRRATRAWPPSPDVCEIGYTWLTRSAIRTAANTEAKLLMLTHAFEIWQVLRVCLHTDVRNQRSRAAIERIGGKFEGILRAHRMAADFTPRDSARYSIIAAEWPTVKQRLSNLLKVNVTAERTDSHCPLLSLGDGWKPQRSRMRCWNRSRSSGVMCS